MSIHSRRAVDIAIITNAAERIGVKPKLALAIAYVESALNPNAKARTSSASGYFQFIRSTWREMMDHHATSNGLSEDVSVFDPEANALMGCQFMKNNINYLKSRGYTPNVRDVYLAHFSGVGTARKVLRQLAKDPHADVSTVFSAAAIRANRGILKGSIGQSYTRLTNKVVRAMKLFS